MHIVLKLFANLEPYLPTPCREKNISDIEVETEATPTSVIERYGIPRELAHLVFINGVYVPPEARDSRRFEESDELAIFPPIAGG